VQGPFYYISKVLSGCETRFNKVQKLLYADLITKRKLLHYFKNYTLHVVTSHGLGEILENCLTTERIAKWALELMGLDITYVPETAIKSQVLPDFVVEWIEIQQLLALVTWEHRIMYFDGSFTLNGVG
jgi:hypothetical protein